jgi:hypothetical protein
MKMDIRKNTTLSGNLSQTFDKGRADEKIGDIEVEHLL